MKQVRVALLVLLVITLALVIDACCQKSTSIVDALERNNIYPDSIFYTDEWNDRAIAFYKGKSDNQIKVGLFEKRKDSWYFLLENDIRTELARSEQISLYTCDLEKGFKDMKIPNFYFECGVVHNPKIETVNLYMVGDLDTKKAKATIVTVDGIRVWYVLRNDKRLYNASQGISKDGQVIYDFRPWENIK